MQTAIKSATKWLKAVAMKDNQKLNPIPYPLFKKALDNQISWAKEQRHIELSFSDIADAVSNNLLNLGIGVMGDNRKKSDTQKQSSSSPNWNFNEIFNPTLSKNLPGCTINLKLNPEQSIFNLLSWLVVAFDRARREGFSQVSLTATLNNS